MHSWRIGIGAVLVLPFLLALGALAARQGAGDPEAALREINAWYMNQVRQAQQSKTQINYAAVMGERTAKAKAAVAAFDVKTIEPSKALALAQLYEIAQMPKERFAAAQRFLTSNPAPDKVFQAQMMLLSGYEESGDVAAMRKLILDMKPPTPQSSATLAYQAARTYSGYIAKQFGPQAALDMLTKVEAGVQFSALTEERDKQLADFTVSSLASARSAILADQGKKAESIAVLEEAIKRLGPDNRYAKSLASTITLSKVVGSPAPELKRERGYGDFAGLASLKGKVVVLDFTAHW